VVVTGHVNIEARTQQEVVHMHLQH